MTNDIKKLENNFVRSLGSGRGMTVALTELIEAAIVEGNGNSLNGALTRARKLGDTHGINATVRVIKAVFPGATVKNTGVDSTKPVAVLTKNADMKTPNEALIGLRSAAAEKLSMRGKAFNDRVFGKKEPKSAEETFAAAIVSADNKGLTEAQMMQLVANHFLNKKAAA